MARKSVPGELVPLWAQARKQGRSWRSIASEHGFDWRTVKGHVLKFMEEEGRAYWESVQRQVDAACLERHYQLLVRVAQGALWAIESDPLQIISGFPPHKEILEKNITRSVEGAQGLLQRGGMELRQDPRGGFLTEDRLLLNRLAAKLLDALREHEPRLASEIDAWGTAWDDLSKARVGLEHQAARLLTTAGVDVTTAQEMAKWLQNEAVRKSLADEEDRTTVLVQGPKDNVRMVRKNSASELEVFRGPETEARFLRKKYESALRQVCHEARIEPVRKAYDTYIRCVQAAKDTIDQLLLRGRPGGRCKLCPQQSALRAV